jgi:hypothetical protein
MKSAFVRIIHGHVSRRAVCKVCADGKSSFIFFYHKGFANSQKKSTLSNHPFVVNTQLYYLWEFGKHCNRENSN